MIINEIIKNLALISWTSFSSFVFFGILANLYYKTERHSRKSRKTDFVIVSVASRGVRNALFATIDHTLFKVADYFNHVYILLDEGAELEGELKRKYAGKVKFAVVPKGYRTDLKAKGRAINYFIEKHTLAHRWYSFIDDDNHVQDDNFLYEIPHYERDGYVATNPILVPRPGKSTATFIMDFLRLFDDLTLFRFSTGLLKTPIIGLHGELLTVKGSVLQELGFDFKSITEDFLFSSQIVRKRYKTWQSRTVVSILSPNSLKDLLKQRGRWFKGILQDLPKVPLIMQLVVGWKLALWTFGIFGSWFFFFLWFTWGAINPFLTIWGGVYYMGVYLYGVYKSKDLKFLPLIPVLGIIETLSFAGGIKQKGFVVINKN